MNKVFRSRHFRGLMRGSLVMGAVMTVGTLGYHHIGRPTATWIDSFYMTFITVATIGYSEVVDLTHHPMGRLFTVGISLVGIVTMTYLFSAFLALLIESDLNAALRRLRMERQIAAMSGHYIVCGLGRVGTNVASELRKTGRAFVVIEQDQAAMDSWLEQRPDTLYLVGDAADDTALRFAGVNRAAGVFAVTGDDSHNLMIALSVKLLNAKARVVVRLHDIGNAGKAMRAGADDVVSPNFTGGMRIASAMLRPHVVNFMDQMLRGDDGLRVEEVVVPANFVPRPLWQLLPRSPEFLLMATHAGGEWLFNPPDNHVVNPGSALILMANPQGRAKVEGLIATTPG